MARNTASSISQCKCSISTDTENALVSSKKNYMEKKEKKTKPGKNAKVESTELVPSSVLSSELKVDRMNYYF